jgi:phospholipid transport system substrate-binding protein
LIKTKSDTKSALIIGRFFCARLELRSCAGVYPKRSFIMRLFIAASSSLIFSLTSAAQERPVDLVEDLSEQTVEFLQDDRLDKDEIDQLLDDVDVDGIARFALGKYSSRITADDYRAYEAAFRSYLRDQMREQLTRFSDGDIEIEDANRRGNQSIIETIVTKPDGETLDVNWRLRKSDAGWEVIDVEAMNLWLAIEQRAQFQAELDSTGGDFGALIKMLGERGAS